MQDIKKYIENALSFQSFQFKNNKNLDDKLNYYENAKADAVHCYHNIKKFLKKDNKESNLKEDLNTYKIIETLKEKINEKIKG